MSNNPVKLIEDFLKKKNLEIEQLRKEIWEDQSRDETDREKMQEFLDKVEEYLGQIHSVMKMVRIHSEK